MTKNGREQDQNGANRKLAASQLRTNRAATIAAAERINANAGMDCLAPDRQKQKN